jgi:transcriptional regulator with XRE-family HTH domain
MNINKIRKLLKEKEITQNDIASQMGLSGNAISQALKKGDFKVSFLEKLAEILEVPIVCFFEEDDKLSNGFKQIANGHGNSQNFVLKTEHEKVMVLEEKIKGYEKEVELLKEVITLLKDKK